IGAGSITSVIANKNSFLATGTALKNEGSGDIDATQNWWNTTSASIITGEIDNASTGSVTYKPYYIDSAMTTLSDNKAISTFDFNGLSPAVTGTVDTSAHTVSLTVPNGTDVTALVPTITTTSVASTPVSPASDVAKDFTNSVTYTISAIDGTTQDYTVTVTVSPDTTGPTISGVTNGETYETAKTVTVGSDAASIFVNNVAYTSGNTITLSANDGYTITATDAIGNSTTVNFTIDIAPAISVQSSSSASATSITITWTTDQPATSRVIYDTVSHSSIADYVAGSNYGYANSTATFDMGDSKTESHSITISGLVAGTTYYYRTISSGSPETVSVTESSFTTSPTTPAPAAAETTETTTSITPLIASAKSAPAPAAEAAPEATATPDDSNGVVKAAEASSPESNESTNWTPWIVLAVLIILAGAVTGGYFYWFSGREEMAAATTGDMKKIQNNAKTENAKVVVREKTKSNTRKPNGKKPNRW
ncbi:hypothetical protein GW916_15645, partial [bacterium]|nr:hypothetical protein [bacterium]